MARERLTITIDADGSASVRREAAQSRRALTGLEKDAVKSSRAMDAAWSKQKQSLGGLKRAAAGTALVLGGAAVGGMVWAAKEIVQAYNESEGVQAQTEARLKSTRMAAGLTAKAIAELATAQSRKTGIDDEAVQSMENVLLTFTQIQQRGQGTNAIFDRATKATLDLSVAFKKDLNGSAILVGKALNDPVKGATALSRAGVQLSADQKKVIERLVETGQTAKAQRIILRELETEFGGASRAAGDTFAGSLNKLKTELGNVEESIGRAVLPSIERFTKSQLVPYANEASDAIGKIFGRRDLSLEDKFKLSSIEVRRIFKPLTDEAGRAIKAADLGDKAADAFSAVIPKFAEAAGKGGIVASKAFLKGFSEASPLGRAVLFTLVMSKLGGLSALKAAGANAGTQVGTGIGEGMARGGGARGAAAALGRSWGPALAAALLASFGPDFVKRVEEDNSLRSPKFKLPKQRLPTGPLLGPSLSKLLFGGDANELEKFGGSAEKALKKATDQKNIKGLTDLANQARNLAARYPSATRELERFANVADKAGKQIASGDLDKAFKKIRDSGGKDIAALAEAVSDATFDIQNTIGRSSRAGQSQMAKAYRVGIESVTESFQKGKISAKQGSQLIRRYVSEESKLGAAALSRNMDSIVASLRSARRRGVITTADMMEQIEGLFRANLKKYGITGKEADRWLKNDDTKTGKSNPGKQAGNEGAGAAVGYLGRPGARGRDKIPLVVGGGEAVLNADQQREANHAFKVARAVGGSRFNSLGDMFANRRSLHYMATGGIASETKTADNETKTGDSWIFRRPPGPVTSGFGMRSSPGGIGSTNHDGIDIGVPVGTPVPAALPGQVVTSGWQGGYGNYVGVQSGNLLHFYGHNSRLLARAGQSVGYRQIIARSGSTGNSTGPHIHLGTHLNGVPRDPLGFEGKVFTVAGGIDASGGGAQGSVPDLPAFQNIKRVVAKGVAGALGGVVQGAIDAVRRGANAKQKDIYDSLGAGDMGFSGGGTSGANQALGKRMMLAFGFGANQWPSLRQLWTNESGWSNTARNPSSGAFGIPQALPPGKMGAAAAGGDAAAQIGWGLRYIKERYGSPSSALSFWNRNNWYAKGGFVKGGAWKGLDILFGNGSYTGPWSLEGKAGTYGGPGDSGDNNVPKFAPGDKNRTPAIATLNSSRGGGWWLVDAPNKTEGLLPQTDEGPTSKTGRKFDVNYTAAPKFGYHSGFPTDEGTWRGKYLGKGKTAHERGVKLMGAGDDTKGGKKPQRPLTRAERKRARRMLDLGFLKRPFKTTSIAAHQKELAQLVADFEDLETSRGNKEAFFDLSDEFATVTLTDADADFINWQYGLTGDNAYREGDEIVNENGMIVGREYGRRGRQVDQTGMPIGLQFGGDLLRGKSQRYDELATLFGYEQGKWANLGAQRGKMDKVVAVADRAARERSARLARYTRVVKGNVEADVWFKRFNLLPPIKAGKTKGEKQQAERVRDKRAKDIRGKLLSEEVRLERARDAEKRGPATDSDFVLVLQAQIDKVKEARRAVGSAVYFGDERDDLIPIAARTNDPAKVKAAYQVAQSAGRRTNQLITGETDVIPTLDDTGDSPFGRAAQERKDFIDAKGSTAEDLHTLAKNTIPDQYVAMLALVKEIADLGKARPKLSRIPDETAAGAGDQSSARADLLQQQLEATQRELNVERAQRPVFDRFPYQGVYHQGGVIPHEGFALVDRGEGIFTPAQMAALGGARAPQIVLYVDGDADALGVRVRAEIDGQEAQITDRVNRGIGRSALLGSTPRTAVYR